MTAGYRGVLEIHVDQRHHPPVVLALDDRHCESDAASALLAKSARDPQAPDVGTAQEQTCAPTHFHHLLWDPDFIRDLLGPAGGLRPAPPPPLPGGGASGARRAAPPPAPPSGPP